MSNPVHWNDSEEETPEPLEDTVSRSENVWGGMATVAGSRVPVFMVADLDSQGETVSEICKRYLHLSPADINAALSYAHRFHGVIAEERSRYWEVVNEYRA